ncbi:hypothetical protein [Holdemanella biformis]|uniref:hypothetical protein n=1 Tax=Holdemanella biformis TaxID=1735 RepID=UPI00189AF753|nr:hypothetical protein [Holdemanella biformis]
MNMEFIKKDDYSGELDYRAFGSMLDHPTQCYKFYWLEAIMNLMLKKHRFSFDEIGTMSRKRTHKIDKF